MKIIAHRGASGEAPENTLAAMALAIEQGADAIEIDVHLCQNELVVIHDHHVDKTTSGTGPVLDYSLAELQQLDAGQGQRVPTLWQVLKLAAGKMEFNIELKGHGCDQPLPELLQRAIDELGYRPEQFIISSFHHPMLARFHRNAPQYAIGALTACCPLDLAKFATDLDANTLHVEAEMVSKELIADAKQRGLPVYVYTVDRPKMLNELKQLGVDGVFTNYPQRSRQHLQQHHQTQGWNT
ncbi:glycerophosphodiester phosphodiesterase [Ferrimonas lipolytica]|uniref:Glycerophosphodiester phosphodiesterase n=1 Tax=Ferrimonas lipolytica TaxID=2724191 RepID=A0A6H1ULG8_9GAMM|nr:glycerophosphodiester phosphodiesterase family protein [Ferrimonas lipolytica]QIZ78642.1 glycerophosphodiester phosphodiesterase [Ferrimonas lipolytica]